MDMDIKKLIMVCVRSCTNIWLSFSNQLDFFVMLVMVHENIKFWEVFIQLQIHLNNYVANFNMLWWSFRGKGKTHSCFLYFSEEENKDLTCNNDIDLPWLFIQDLIC